MSIETIDLGSVYSGGTTFEQHVLFDANLEIKDGESVGLTGHTDSGKSTLTQHLNGLVEASVGELYHNGENIYGQGYDMKQLRSKVGLIFQYPEHRLFEVDVLVDVCFGPKNQGLSKKEVKARVKKVPRQVDLSPFYYKQSPSKLSGDQKRRATITSVLATEPEVPMLGGPTADLDPRGRDEILDRTDGLHKERHMIITPVSHSMEDMARYTNRLIMMNHGQKVFDGAPKEIFCHYRGLETMGLAAPQMTYLVYDLEENGIDINDDITTVARVREAILILRNKLTESNRDKNI